MKRRAELLDVEAQQADHNAAMRAEARDADRYDRTAYVRVAGRWMPDEHVPHPSDVADLGDH